MRNARPARERAG